MAPLKSSLDVMKLVRRAMTEPARLGRVVGARSPRERCSLGLVGDEEGQAHDGGTVATIAIDERENGVFIEAKRLEQDPPKLVQRGMVSEVVLFVRRRTSNVRIE